MPSRLRVAVLATIVDFGGIERVLLTLFRYIGAEIELVPVLFTRAGDERNVFLVSLDASKITYHTIHVDGSRYKYANPVRNIGEIIGFFRSREFDLIHTHGYRADLIGLIVAKWFDLPIVSTCHGFIPIDRRLRIYNRLDMFLLRYFDRVIAVSERIKKDLVEGGVRSSNIQLIPNAVWDEAQCGSRSAREDVRARMGIAREEFVFGFMGRLSEEKGLMYLLQAIREWSPVNRRWRVLLVGDGPQRAILEQAVHEFELADKVVFAGFQDDAARWYAAMDALVLPSLTEGTPMVLLEAMAHGIPVVATAVGGVPAVVVGGQNGILVPPKDPSRLREAMQSLIANDALRTRLGTSAANLIRREYNVANWIRQVTEAYTATIKRGGRPHRASRQTRAAGKSLRRSLAILADQCRSLSVPELIALLWDALFRSERVLIYWISLQDSEIVDSHKTDNSLIVKGELVDLERARSSAQRVPWEFKCDLYDDVKEFFVFKDPDSGLLGHISWLYYEGDPNRTLRLGGKECEVRFCLTLPEFRGRGLYREALRTIQRYLRNRGYERCFVCVRDDNVASIRGIEKAGFTLVAETRFRKVLGLQISRRWDTNRSCPGTLGNSAAR